MSQKVTLSVSQEVGRYAYIVKRSERLLRAVYLITDIMPEREPLRWLLRKHALRLLDEMNDASMTDTHRLAFLVTVILERIMLGRSLGLISEMNMDHLVRAYETLRDDIAKGIGGRGAQLSSTILYPTGEEVNKATERMLDQDRASSIGQPRKHVTDRKKRSVKRVERPPRTVVAKRDEADDRREVLLSRFRKDEKLAIRDVMERMPGFSEKTIQRDLVALTDDSKLIREGKRRWTTYRLP